MEKQRFVEIDGCINCDSYNAHRNDEIQLHEAMGSCLLFGCQSHGHTVLKPYIGTHELKYILKNKALPSGKPMTDVMIDRVKQLLDQRKPHSSGGKANVD